MKNKHGFTLVEMLAVIVLIAVLSVVAVSTYRGINESSKKKTLEAKISQIESAAEKWAKENNITTRMTISVNTLVVEGYLTADEVGTDGLAEIKNPVTSENMICNTIDLSFKEGVIESHYNSNNYNCKLATQSLVDSNISIKVLSASNKNLTGSGSIAKWTNENIILIVNSNKYDAKATSISYDFEGSTITKSKETLTQYTGNSYIDEAEAKKYYNVYHINSELLLDTNIIVTYDIPGEGTKSRAYTIRFDKEEATASIESNIDWLTASQPVKIKLEDGKGSGPKNFYISTDPLNYDATKPTKSTYQGVTINLNVGKYYIWTEDNAGNISNTYKLEFDVNNKDDVTPGCEILFHGTEGNHGWYISNVTPGAQNNPKASISGVNIGISKNATPVYSVFAKYDTQTEVQTNAVNTNTTKSGIRYYCFAKSLAGKTAVANRVLKIDKTPPTLELSVNNLNTYTKNKAVRVVISDALSGINKESNIRFGLSQSSGAQPGNWIDLTINGTEGGATATLDFNSTFEVTGEYYVWIDASQVTDYAGNHLAQNYYVSALGKYDNTPPSCEISNVSNQCTTGGISCTVTCSDDDSGIGSCPGNQSGLQSSTTFSASDNAGNISYCRIIIESTTQYREAYCSTGNRCSDAGCEEYTTTRYCVANKSTDCPSGTPYDVYTSSGLGCTIIASHSGVGQMNYAVEECTSCSLYNRSINTCGCETWGTWTAWENTAKQGCTLNNCKSESRVVYHSGGTCNEEKYSGHTITCGSSKTAFVNVTAAC